MDYSETEAIPMEKMMSVKEAAEFWGINQSTLGSKLSRNKDKEGWQYFTTGRKATKRKKKEN